MKEVLKSFDWVKIGLIVFIVFLINSLYVKCQSEKVQLANVSALNSELKSYQLKNGKLVLSYETLVYTNKQLKESILEKDKVAKEIASKFSKVNTVTKFVTKIEFDTVKIVYRDTIEKVFERKGSLVTKDYHIDYISNQKGFTIDYLAIHDSLTIVTGMKRNWFLGKQTQTIDVSHSNKYVNNGVVTYVEVKNTKKLYETTFFKVGVGLLGGIILF